MAESYRAERAARARAGGGRRPGPGEGRQARPRRRRPGEGLRRRPAFQASPASPSVASRPASSLSKARKTRGQPRKPSATRSTPWVPRAETEGMPQEARASQSKTPSATTAKRRSGAETPKSKHRLGAGQGPGTGASRRGSKARPTSQWTSPPERACPVLDTGSGTTTIPANRSEPRSVNSPQSLSRPASKPTDSRACRKPSPGAKPRPSRTAASRPTPREARYSRKLRGCRRSCPA